MKGYYIQVTNGLLDSKHFKKMGPAVWLFMWLLDKMTSISEEGIGLVLGGKPIKYEEVKEDLEMSYATYKRWLSTLKKENYIITIRTPYGHTIKVCKAQKTFGQKHRQLKNELSKKKGESSNVSQRKLKNEPQIAQKSPNKEDKTVDKTVDKTRRRTPEKHLEYLMQIPPQDLKDLGEQLGLSTVRITSKAEELYDYCMYKGRRYKNYKSFLRNALKKDFVVPMEKPGKYAEFAK